MAYIFANDDFFVVPNQERKKAMKTAFQIPDEWAEKIDAICHENGDCSRSAIIRKALQIFIASWDNKKQQHKNDETQTARKEHAEG